MPRRRACRPISDPRLLFRGQPRPRHGEPAVMPRSRSYRGLSTFRRRRIRSLCIAASSEQIVRDRRLGPQCRTGPGVVQTTPEQRGQLPVSSDAHVTS